MQRSSDDNPPSERTDPRTSRTPPPLQASATLLELAFGASTDMNEDSQRNRSSNGFDNLRIDLGDPEQRTLADYELLELIGEGGMGLVYRARQKSLDREVALKLLAAGPWASDEFVERFKREAKQSARMEHPNIVTVYDVGTIEQLHFFSMRLVRGETLARRVRRTGPLDARFASQLMRTVAEAVDYAHQLDVLHLDLKPGNILLDETDTPYVSDFGLARRLDRRLAVDNVEVAGTPSYMAPEQTRTHHGRLSAATDIWSLGAICHELVTGLPPFRADSARATLDLVRKGRIRQLHRSHPQVPRDLEAIILKCLSKEPDDRYRSARALADDLGRFLDHREVRARPLNPFQRLPRLARREPKLVTTMALALSALLLSLAVTTHQWNRADANAQRASFNAATARERLWDMRDQAALRFTEAGDGWLAVPALLANLGEQLASGATDHAAIARKRLGILENSNPYPIDAIPIPPPSALAFSEDGRHLAIGSRYGQLVMIDVRSGARLWTRSARTNSGNDSDGMSSLAFSPDGRFLVTSAAGPHAMIQPSHAHMRLFDADNGEAIEPPAVFGTITESSYSANGRFALLTNTNGESQMWATQPWRAIGIKARLAATSPGILTSRLVAANGRFVVVAPSIGAPVLVDAHTLAARALAGLANLRQATAWTLSQDSRWLAIGDAAGGVHVIDCESGKMHALTPQSPQGIRWLSFSGDGLWLAAAAGAAGIFLWDWPQNQLLALPFGGDPAVDQVRVDKGHFRVMSASFAANESASGAVWEVAPVQFDMDRSAAVQLGERFAPAGTRTSVALAWQPAIGLLATASRDAPRSRTEDGAMLHVQRFPPAFLRTAHGAPLKPGELGFGGDRLVSVDSNRVQVVDAISEAVVGASIELPQAPGFAELTPAGNTLVVSAGRTLDAYNASTGKSRLAQPIVLHNSPQRIVIRPDGRAVLTTWLAHNADGVSEVAELWDIETGRRLAGPVNLRGPLEGIRYDADSRRLVAWSRRQLSVRDGANLDLVSGPFMAMGSGQDRTDSGNVAWVSANFDPSGAAFAVIDETEDDGHRVTRLLDLDGSFAANARSLPAGTVDVVPLHGKGRMLVVSSTGAVEVLAPGDKGYALPDQPGSVPSPSIAVSRDGHWIARALRDGVELHADGSATRVAHLRAPLPLPDRVWQLAFSPDGSRLLARSVRNRYLVWNLASDTRPLGAIERSFALRGVPGVQTLASMPTATERAALHAFDPGPTPGADEAALPAIRQLPGGGVPPRSPATPSDAIDLDRWYNFALGGVNRASRQTAGDFGWLPQGPQRLLGVDYDLRGFIQLHDPAAPFSAQVPIPRQVRIELPSARRFSILHALVLAQFATAPGKAASAVDLLYGNGRSARLPILAADDVHGYWRTDIGTRARLAAYGWDSRALQARGAPAHVYAVRLTNPHPRWPVRALALTTLPGMGGAPAFLALTTESPPDLERRLESSR